MTQLRSPLGKPGPGRRVGAQLESLQYSYTGNAKNAKRIWKSIFFVLLFILRKHMLTPDLGERLLLPLSRSSASFSAYSGDRYELEAWLQTNSTGAKKPGPRPRNLWQGKKGESLGGKRGQSASGQT